MQVLPLDNIPNTTSAPEVWTDWYDELQSRYGTKVAKQLWTKAWSLRGGDQSQVDVNTAALRDAMLKNGITIDSSGITQLEDATRRTVGGVTDFLGDIFTMGKWAAIGTGALILLGTGFLIYNIARKPESFSGAAKAALI